MWQIKKSHPVLASFTAALVAVLPLLIVVLIEVENPQAYTDADDGAFQGAGLTLAALPFLFIAGVPIIFFLGNMLMALGLMRLTAFLSGAVAMTLVIAAVGAAIAAASVQFDWVTIFFVFVSLTLVSVPSALLSAVCWWCLAVRPHNKAFEADASRRST